MISIHYTVNVIHNLIMNIHNSNIDIHDSTYAWKQPGGGGGGGGGGTPYVMGDTYVPRFWPLFSLWQDRARSFWGIFLIHQQQSYLLGVQKLPIFTKIDLFGPKFNFFLDLFGSNFQRPAAHPHQSPPPPPPPPPGGNSLRLTREHTVRLLWSAFPW